MSDLSDEHLHLGGDEAHYLNHVLRLRPGDRLTLFDGAGHEAEAEIIGLDAEAVALRVEPPQAATALPCSLTVALPAPKGERADWAVEKLTEVGVSRIVWLDCSRSVTRVRPEGERLSRWQRLAVAAARQSGRASVPELCGPLAFTELLRLPADQRFVGDVDATTAAVACDVRGPQVLFAVGPEGGFSAAELHQAYAEGFAGVRLGPLTLRLETAAVVGAAALMGRVGAGGGAA